MQDLEQAGIRLSQIDEAESYLLGPWTASVSPVPVWTTRPGFTVICATAISNPAMGSGYGRRCDQYRGQPSNMDLPEGFRRLGYPNEIGPVIYDIHSSRVPEVTELIDLTGLGSRAQRETMDQPRLRPENPPMAGGARSTRSHSCCSTPGATGSGAER